MAMCYQRAGNAPALVRRRNSGRSWPHKAIRIASERSLTWDDERLARDRLKLRRAFLALGRPVWHALAHPRPSPQHGPSCRAMAEGDGDFRLRRLLARLARGGDGAQRCASCGAKARVGSVLASIVHKASTPESAGDESHPTRGTTIVRRASQRLPARTFEALRS